MRLRAMSLRDFTAYAEQLNEWIENIAEASQGEFTGEDLVAAIEAKTHHPWAWTTDEDEFMGVVVTTFGKLGDEKLLSFIGAAGNCMDSWEEFTDLANTLAKQLNCKYLEMRGRRGLLRRFKDTGWTEAYTVVRRVVMPMAGLHPMAAGE